MNINSYQSKNCLSCRSALNVPVPTFKGYDARPLNSVLMTVCDNPKAFDIIKQMSEIGKKNGFKVYFTNQTNRLYENLDKIKDFFKICNHTNSLAKWTQDHAILTPENKVFTHKIYTDESIAKRITAISKAKFSYTDYFVEGGNLFFVKNGTREEILIGAKETELIDPDILKKLYGAAKIHIIPQSDFHIDMFLRPLNNKRILVADDELMIHELKQAIKNIKQYRKQHSANTQELENLQKKLENTLSDFSNEAKNNKNPSTNEVVKTLVEKGFQPIKIPGRLYSRIPNKSYDNLKHSLNYMNAVVHEKPNGTLTFITNKSILNEKLNITPEISQQIDFDFEKILIKYLEPYIKKEDIHFISGKENYLAYLLKTQNGGIHCLCNEIPEKVM